MVDDGGLAAYAANLQAMFRRSAVHIVKIFNGAKPDQRPVELPARFEFAINLKTAKAIGLTSLLQS
jgi:putative tryptophan/tyrosine transport system substrate-binding protein